MTLATLIDERGLKRSWIAEQMAVSRSTVTRWTQRKMPFPVKRAHEFSKITGIPLRAVLAAIEGGG